MDVELWREYRLDLAREVDAARAGGRTLEGARAMVRGLLRSCFGALGYSGAGAGRGYGTAGKPRCRRGTGVRRSGRW